MQPQTKIFSRVVADYMDGAPLVLPSSATVRHMLDRMTTTKASCVLVADGNGRLSGLVTETDVVNRIALRATGVAVDEAEIGRLSAEATVDIVKAQAAAGASASSDASTQPRASSDASASELEASFVSSSDTPTTRWPGLASITRWMSSRTVE